jgi:hypothetical protein
LMFFGVRWWSLIVLGLSSTCLMLFLNKIFQEWTNWNSHKHATTSALGVSGLGWGLTRVWFSVISKKMTTGLVTIFP